MVQINFANKEIQCKIVYYGPGMSGKTTNLEVVHKKAPNNAKGDLTSIATEGDRTLFFDFMPLDLGNIAGIKTKFQLYTVPGQVYYNSTRKLVLQGVDGIVFVADSQAEKIDENLEALENLKGNLREYGRDIESIPVVFQWNKRDLPTALPVDELERRMNPMGAPSFEAVAATGEGVFPTLKALASLVLESINRDKKDSGVRAPAAVATAGATRTAPAARPAARPAAPAAPPPQARRAPPPPPPPRQTAPVRPAAAQVAPPPPPPPRGRKGARVPEPVGVGGTIAKPAGRVQIKERTDTGRLFLTIVVAAVIIGAVGFLIMKYL
jgi:signal recognition particle receptor subunit beta